MHLGTGYMMLYGKEHQDCFAGALHIQVTLTLPFQGRFGSSNIIAFGRRPSVLGCIRQRQMNSQRYFTPKGTEARESLNKHFPDTGTAISTTPKPSNTVQHVL